MSEHLVTQFYRHEVKVVWSSGLLIVQFQLGWHHNIFLFYSLMLQHLWLSNFHGRHVLPIVRKSFRWVYIVVPLQHYLCWVIFFKHCVQLPTFLLCFLPSSVISVFRNLSTLSKSWSLLIVGLIRTKSLQFWVLF